MYTIKSLFDRVLQIIATLTIEFFYMNSIPAAAEVSYGFGIVMTIGSIGLAAINAALIWRFIGYVWKFMNWEDWGL